MPNQIFNVVISLQVNIESPSPIACSHSSIRIPEFQICRQPSTEAAWEEAAAIPSRTQQQVPCPRNSTSPRKRGVIRTGKKSKTRGDALKTATHNAPTVNAASAASASSKARSSKPSSSTRPSHQPIKSSEPKLTGSRLRNSRNSIMETRTLNRAHRLLVLWLLEPMIPLFLGIMLLRRILEEEVREGGRGLLGM
ncbi:hypothetical protein BD289DRAFT_286454 [Coniella lustricola]|uniref:Uncharacterized protein n=1 Tax=Coniella lustricola TaxID=2025994 RepID=A0A2T3A5M0_9PEZI|nr:hypothetical protein BD289DRAFT_286454 [Coniella lustricola]